MSNRLVENIRIIEEAERQGKRFCPQCGNKMKTCCDVHRQLNIMGHTPNGIHEAPEEWVCFNCGLREYRELAMRAICGRAGTL
ncbi:MAG: hypothetical protein ACBZ72_05500 [Candidatus Bathyarchaeia archaeon]